MKPVQSQHYPLAILVSKMIDNKAQHSSQYLAQ